MPSILLIDDDDRFSHTVATALKAAGFEVTTARDHDRALDIVSSDAPLDLLIANIGMPNRINEFALARSAKTRRPDLKVIYITAFDDMPGLETGGTVLRRPISDGDLVAAVAAELAVASGAI